MLEDRPFGHIASIGPVTGESRPVVAIANGTCLSFSLPTCWLLGIGSLPRESYEQLKRISGDTER
jgi:hypothetical protein